MKKNIINMLLVITILALSIYLLYSLIQPRFYNKEITTEELSNKEVSVEEVDIINDSFEKYMEACLDSDLDKIKDMLPLVEKSQIDNYSNLCQMYKEKDITTLQQNVIYDIRRVSGNVFQIKFYSKTGNIVDGIVKDTIIMKIIKTSNSFRIFYDENLYVEGE